MSLTIRPEAQEDISEAFDWYEDRTPGLGYEFLRSVRACLAQIERAPAMFPRSFEDTRRASVRRFPLRRLLHHRRAHLDNPCGLSRTARPSRPLEQRARWAIRWVDEWDERDGRQRRGTHVRLRAHYVKHLSLPLIRRRPHGYRVALSRLRLHEQTRRAHGEFRQT